MNEAITTNSSSEHDFPANSPNLLKKIPRPVFIGGIILISLLLVVVTFPRKSKAKSIIKYPVDESAAVDNYEQQSPIQTDPFSTSSMDNTGKNSSALARSASLGENTGFSSQNMQSPAMIDKGASYSGATGGSTGNGSPSMIGAPAENIPYKLSGRIENRLNESYQSMVSHFKKTNQMAVVPVKDDEYPKLLKGDKLDKVEPALKNLTENSARFANKVNFDVPSGTRIRAVTQQEVNSDHPGYFTARITSPMDLAGYKLLCQSRGNARDRIPVTANKIIAPDGSRETQIPGEVQMKYAGLEGDVKSHVLKRLVPPIASAFVGAGAGYLYFKALGGDELNSEAGRINTADAVVGAPYQEGISGVQNEINRFGGDYPNTVTVPQGTQFELLVTDPFSIEL